MVDSNGMYGEDDLAWLEGYLILVQAVIANEEVDLGAVISSCWDKVTIKVEDEMGLYNCQSATEETEMRKQLFRKFSDIVVENAEEEDEHFNHFLVEHLVDREEGPYEGM